MILKLSYSDTILIRVTSNSFRLPAKQFEAKRRFLLHEMKWL